MKSTAHSLFNHPEIQGPETPVSLQQTLQLCRRALDASSCGITISDLRKPDHPVIYVNPAFERLTGYTAEEVIGRNCRFLQGGEQDQPAVAELRAAVKERRECTVVLHNYRKDGTPFWNELILSPVFDGGGTLTHYIGVQTDVTRRMHAEAALQRANAALERRVAAEHSLALAEKELLEKTLVGGINVLVEALAMADPAVYARVRKVCAYTGEVAGSLECSNRWELELSALLSQIGYLTLKTDAPVKDPVKAELTEEEKEMQVRVPEIGSLLVSKIPRLQGVAQNIRYQFKHYNGEGVPHDDVAGDRIPFGARLFKILWDLVGLEEEGQLQPIALRILHARTGWYDPQLLDRVIAHFTALQVKPRTAETEPTEKNKPPVETVAKNTQAAAEALKPGGAGRRKGALSVAIAFHEIVVGDILTADIHAADGSLLLSAGHTVTEPLLHVMQHIVKLKGVEEPVYVAASAEGSQETSIAA